MAAFKIAGAVCAAGMDLDSVEALAIRASACTRGLGVAFCVCTLPGSDKLVFSVPEARMSLRLGIQGEPGIGQTDRPTIGGLADLLVRCLMDERPKDRRCMGRMWLPSLTAWVLLSLMSSLRYTMLSSDVCHSWVCD